MEEDFRISKESGFLYVQGVRTISPVVMQRFLSQIPDAARDADTHKVLVDARETKGSLGIAERFEYATRLAEHLRGQKVAFVLHLVFEQWQSVFGRMPCPFAGMMS